MIKDNLENIDVKDATLVAASKYVGSQSIRKLYNLGVTNMGENRVQAFLEKFDELTDCNISWHFIGHLQRNKVKDVINKIEYLHSLDSVELAEVIEKYAKKPVKCFIEINSGEESKTGIPYEYVYEFLEELKKFTKIEVIGFMTMAPNTEDEEVIRSVFMKLRNLRDSINKDFKLSMGMSHDYKIALECGATHVRIGSILWKGEM